MSSHASPGMKFGRYRLIEQIGAGGMGVVFRARDEKLERDVAIKVIKAGLFDADARERFRREALILSKLNHPGIQVIHDFDHEGEIDFLVVEFIQGRSLDEMVAAGPLALEKVTSLGRQLAAALASAHDQGILHRDLKPSNIRVTPDGHLKVLDFGLAKFYMAAPEAETEMLQTGGVVGTGPYLAPELLMGAQASVASDIYAAGIVLYEMATGQRPFTGTIGELIPKVMSANVPAPSTVNANVPRDLEAIILKAMSRNAEDRFANARELQSALEETVGSSQRVIASAAGGARRRWTAGIVAGAVVALTVGTWAYLRRPISPLKQGIRSLAVLPLADLSKEAGQEYIVAGMTDQLTSQLGSLPSLKVISRSSAANYANSKLRSGEIAQRLGVDALVEGTVMKSGDAVRVTLELIDGSTDQQLWSQAYERKTRDLFGVQREIAESVARQIHLKLTGEEQKQFAEAGTTNPAAYDAFLRARYKSRTALATREDAQAELDYAELAVKEDPQFAEAYLLIADASSSFLFSFKGGREYDEKAALAIDKAMALNPRMPAAYGQLGHLYYSAVRGWDIETAIKNYRKALELNPNFADAHHLMGSELTHAGFNNEAVVEFKKALELDPESYGAKFRLGRALMQGNRFAEAIDTFQRYGIHELEEAASYAYLGKFEEAIRVTSEMKQTTAITARDGSRVQSNKGTKDREVPAALALVYALQGKRQEALAEIGKMHAEEFGPHFHHSALLIAAAYAEMGMAHEAVRELEFCAKNGMPAYPVFRDNPSLKKLAGNPEYERLMSELKPRSELLRAAFAEN